VRVHTTALRSIAVRAIVLGCSSAPRGRAFGDCQIRWGLVRGGLDPRHPAQMPETAAAALRAVLGRRYIILRD
jgi:hypothetical protein